MSGCPGDKMAHGPPAVYLEKPGAQYWAQRARFDAELKERVENAGDFRGGGFRWDRTVHRLGLGWTPACMVPQAKLHVQGDGLPVARPLALRVDGKSGADAASPRGEVFFGDISLSTYATEEVHFEIATPARATRSRGFRYAGGPKTALAGGELIDVNVTPADVEYGTGTALGTHRGAAFNGPTISATSAKAVSVAVTAYFSAPTAGALVTLDQSYYNLGSFALYSTGGAHFTTTKQNHNKPQTPVSICRPNMTAVAQAFEYRDLHITSGNSIQWTTAPPTTLRMVVLNDGATVLTSTVAAVVDDAASVYIHDAPLASTNVTVTRPWALWVFQGASRFGGSVTIDGLTVDRVVVTGTAGLLSTDDRFQWDNTNKTALIRRGSSAALSLVSSTARALRVQNDKSDDDVAILGNAHASGYSSLSTVGSDNVVKTAFGYGNASATDTTRAGKAFWWTADTIDYLWTQAKGAPSTELMSLSANGELKVTAYAKTSGTPNSALKVIGAAHTGLASTAFADVYFNLARTITLGSGGGTIAEWNAVNVEAPTISSGTATTISDLTTLTLQAAPSVAGSVTGTRKYALWVKAGNVRIDASLGVNCAGAPSHAVDLRGASGAEIIRVQNTTTTGTSAFLFYKSDSNFQCAAGYANASFGVALRAGKGFWWTGGNNFIITDDTSTYFESKQATASLTLLGISDDTKIGTAATTDATVATCGSYTPGVSRTVRVVIHFVAFSSGAATGASYYRTATFRVNGAGTVTQIGATRTIGTDDEDTAGWDSTIDTSGGAIRGRVTGAAATNINWRSYWQIQYVT